MRTAVCMLTLLFLVPYRTVVAYLRLYQFVMDAFQFSSNMDTCAVNYYHSGIRNYSRRLSEW